MTSFKFTTHLGRTDKHEFNGSEPLVDAAESIVQMDRGHKVIKLGEHVVDERLE